jgi:CPA2 family monovalent cation:H+ antiporter-2
MGHSTLLRDLIVLYGMAMVIAFLMRRARQPTIVGYLLTGIVAGPFGLKLIADTSAVEILAEVGVALLLFTIGLELSFTKLMRMRQWVLGAGSLQLAATVTLVTVLMLWWGFPLRQTVFWGFLIAASSTAIVLRLLQERGELETAHGRIILGILLFQDLCVVPMMALVPVLAAPGAARAFAILIALAKSLIVVGGILLGARYLFPPLLKAIVLVRSRELFVIATIFFVFGTAWGAEQLGLSLALGAFLAGIVLSESEYGHQIMAEILPFRDSFNSLFFIAVGMLIDLQFAARTAGVLAAVTLVIIFGKLLTAGAAVKLLRFPMRMSILVGLGLAQVGEFSFVLLREGGRVGLVPLEHYQLFLTAAVLSMLLAPSLIAASPRISNWLGDPRPMAKESIGAPPEKEQWNDHVIVCGFGMNGRRTAALLRENHLPYIIIEMNGQLVRRALQEGEPIFFGDVSSVEILRQAGAQRARAIVFAISDPAILPRAISHARMLNPDLHIIARIKRAEDIRELRQAGATDVVAEEVEAWMEIAVRLLRLYGMPREAVAEQLESLRGADYEMARILHLPGQPLRHLWHLLPNVDLELFIIAPGSPMDGLELRQIELRTRTGSAVLAVVRGTEVIHNPPGEFKILGGDQLVLIGSREQLTAGFSFLRDSQFEPKTTD